MNAFNRPELSDRINFKVTTAEAEAIRVESVRAEVSVSLLCVAAVKHLLAMPQRERDKVLQSVSD